MMGDNVADLPRELDAPPIPPKTYQWEDLRRQKLEGRYPWTHLYKPPFDIDEWEESKEHEYEPITPMDRKLTPPRVRITLDNEEISSKVQDTSSATDNSQDTSHLQVPKEQSECEDTDTEDEIEDDITAEELQNRLEERYFRNLPKSVKHDYETAETRSVSPAFKDNESINSSTTTKSGLSNKMQYQADKIKQKFKTFKDQLSQKDDHSDVSPSLKRKKRNNSDGSKKQKSVKKNKFNFRKRNTKQQQNEPKPKTSSERSKFHMPSVPHFSMPQAPHFSFPNLSTFSRSRSNSVKEKPRKRSVSSEIETHNRKWLDFNFSTYPRLFKQKSSSEDRSIKESSLKINTKSAPASPFPRRSPFTSRWINKFTDSHKKDENKQNQNDNDKSINTVVQESVFISLHDDLQKTDVRNVVSKSQQVDSKIESQPSKKKTDTENFIFVSLHEERFPEKLHKLREQEREEHECDEATRKLQNMLRRIHNQKRAKQAAANGQFDEPREPITIIEITNDDECDNVRINQEGDVEMFVGGSSETLNNQLGERIQAYQFKDNIENIVENFQVHTQQKKVSNYGPTSTVFEEKLTELKTDSQLKEVPQKTPRKKIQKGNSEKSLEKSQYVFENIDTQLDNQQPTLKKSISSCLEEIDLNCSTRNDFETEQKQFEMYAKALENNQSFSSVEIDPNYYCSNSALADLETPMPPVRPSRMHSLQKTKFNKKSKSSDESSNPSFNTFPVSKPARPKRRRFAKHRAFSDSTNSMNKKIDALEDAAINQNIVNSKQLSVSFLPLTSDVADVPITMYDMRETSSMIHLNLKDVPPKPPKRTKNLNKYDTTRKYHSLPNRRYDSKTSLSTSETYNINIDTADFKYADDVSSSNIAINTPPKRPIRKKVINNEIETLSREIESLTSGKSVQDDLDFCDTDSKEFSVGYAVIGNPNEKSQSATKVELQTSQKIKKPRRFSDFFTFPRIRVPTNYILPASYTLGRDRRASPSRPPRKSKPTSIPSLSQNERSICEIDFTEEEQLNFNLATEDDDNVEESITEKYESKNLQTEYIFEKMKTRPLPPPPRPTRKPKTDTKNENSSDYSHCTKNKKSEFICIEERNNSEMNNLNQTTLERKIINTTGKSVSTSDQNIRTVQSRNTFFEQFAEKPLNEPFEQTFFQQITQNSSNKPFENANQQEQQLPEPLIKSSENVTPQNQGINVITAQKLHVSELSVSRLNISEIESSKLTTSSIDSSTMQISQLKSDTSHIAINSIELPVHSLLNHSDCIQSPEVPCEITDVFETGIQSEQETTQSATDFSSHDNLFAAHSSTQAPEISSEVERDIRVVRPNRRKQSIKKERTVAESSAAAENGDHPSVAELVYEILQICHSSVGQAIHSLLEQVIPEDREKRNEVQAAIWVITIIVAGCLMLGIQSNEKIVHHHHWDFHFPPPH